jgi:hypothetical protein
MEKFSSLYNEGGAGDRYSQGQIIQLRNRFTAQIGQTARFQIAQIRIIEIITYSNGGQTILARRQVFSTARCRRGSCP